MKISKCNEQSIQAAVRTLKAGGCVVFPTDTAYGLAVDATNKKAVRRLYRIKGRNFNKPVHVVVSSLAQAKKLVRFTPLAERLFKKFLPGALTLVLPLKYNSPSPPLKLRGGRRGLWILSAGTGTLGIRMPNNHVASALVKKFGRPITATSANVSGESVCYSAAAVVAQFKGRKFQTEMILDSGRLPKVKPSTIVAIKQQSVKILREGPISRKQILKNLSMSFRE
ncbi:MAG: L-threonylcarbamoyladenylate synthase [Patescibacteria group bacterium]|nr:L-threonylcarbamoyladenylate synthase [Patescibacteria group bacterium]